MSRTERAGLVKELFSVQSSIFSGVSEEEFAHHVVNSPAKRTVIQVYRGANGNIVGYCAFHRFMRRMHGRDMIVIRAEAGLLADYRGRGAAHWFGMSNAFLEKLRHPFTPVYYFGTLVHPSSYRFFCKYFPRVHPRLDGGMLETMEALALELADSFNDPPANPDDALVRNVGWITIEQPDAHLPRRGEEHADIRYFKTRNPGYRLGHGLVVLIPVTLSNVTRAMLRRIVVVALQRLRLTGR